MPKRSSARAIAVKICGLTELRGLEAAIDAGAAYVGFVFARRSPRFLDAETARDLEARVPRPVTTVGLFVEPSDAELKLVLDRVDLDMIQLHGQESPERVAAIKQLTRLPVMKALGIAVARDVVAAGAYERDADIILFDAKPPPEATRPGGNALAFDWSLLRAYAGPLPWGLAGGLTNTNVAAAIAASGAAMLDVSSGVESRPGVKSPAKIRAFMAAVAAASLG
jgi:phosphoribosylanthranilate isomerase